MEGSSVKIIADQISHAIPFEVCIGMQTFGVLIAVFSITALALAVVVLVKSRAERKNSFVQFSSAMVLAAVLVVTLFRDTKSSSKARNVNTSVIDVLQEGQEESPLGLGSFTTMRPIVHHELGAAKEQTPLRRRSSRLFSKMQTFPCSSESFTRKK